ncbi:MAG: hypothetical protein IPH56_10725 [Chitinophagaceae bacterium]|nr:hypothetical protein [Chitinophagaceae bacterium]
MFNVQLIILILAGCFLKQNLAPALVAPGVAWASGYSNGNNTNKGIFDFCKQPKQNKEQ